MSEFDNLNFNKPSSGAQGNCGQAGVSMEYSNTSQPSSTGGGPSSPLPAMASAPSFRQKLFRLKNMEQLQDTEENADDSELKVNSGVFFRCC